MAPNKQRLRPWLIAQIDNRSCEGLLWIEKSQKIFRIPWKHGGKQDWDPKYSQVFKAWAINTGKHRDGHDKLEWAKWKTRLRCAFNKAQDIQEIKERSDVDAADPYKVYQFLTKNNTANPKPKLEKKAAIKHEKKEEKIHPAIPKLEAFDSAKSGDFPSDLEGIGSMDLLKGAESVPQMIATDMDSIGTSIGALHLDDQEPCSVTVDANNFPTDEFMGGPLLNATGDIGGLYYNQSPDRSPLQGDLPGPQPEGAIFVEEGIDGMELEGLEYTITSLQTLPSNADCPFGDFQLILSGSEMELYDVPSRLQGPLVGHEMHLRVQYISNIHLENKWGPIVVVEQRVNKHQGCRLHYGSDHEIRSVTSPEMAEKMLGPADAVQILLPTFEDHVTKEFEEYSQRLLENMARGIHIECDNGDIYATRLCKCFIYFCNEQNEKGIKLERDVKTKIFDYHDFNDRYQRYKCDKENYPPSTEVRLSFGKPSTYTRITQSAHISAFISSIKAEVQLKEIIDDGMQISEADENDVQLDRLLELSL